MKKIISTLAVFLIAVICLSIAVFMTQKDINVSDIFTTATTSQITTEPTTTQPPPT